MIRRQLGWGLALVVAVVTGLAVDRHVLYPVGVFMVLFYGGFGLSVLIESIVRERRSPRNGYAGRNWLAHASSVRVGMFVVGLEVFRLLAESAHSAVLLAVSAVLLAVWYAALVACGVAAGIGDPRTPASHGVSRRRDWVLEAVLPLSGVVLLGAAAWGRNWTTGGVAVAVVVSAFALYAIVRAALSHVRSRPARPAR